MTYFIKHKLIQDQDGYIVELYLNQQLCEFSIEFPSLRKKGTKPRETDNLEKAVDDYLKEKLPGFKIKAVNIMLGSLLIASIPFSNIHTSTENPPDLTTTQNLTVTSYPVIAKDKPPNIISNPRDVLVLVNKNNSLPYGYVPGNLTVPDVPFSFEGYDDKKLMQQDAASALEEMFRSAEVSGINLYAVSGYRSYARQSSIFAAKADKYGQERANQTSAKPGQSEHQTGLAMDVSSASVNYGLSQSFGSTKEGKWVKENASKYGFIIRYQQGKESITGYLYEPWHLRYVGREAAKEISNQNITLEEFLGAR